MRAALRTPIRAASLAAMALAGAFTACTLVVDTDGLSSPAPAFEGGAPTDASVEGGGGEDVPVPVDPARPTDGAPAADAALTCAGETICEDFEGPQPNGAWTVHVSAGGTLALDAVRPRSGSRSLHIVRAAGAPTAAGFLRLTLPAKPELECSLDVWVSALQAGERIQFLTVGHDVTDPSYDWYESIFAVLRPNEVELGQHSRFIDGGKRTEGLSFPTPSAAGQWLHILVRLRPAEAVMEVTTESGLTSSRTNPLTAPERTSTNIKIGVPYGEGTSRIDTHVDNVRCVVK